MSTTVFSTPVQYLSSEEYFSDDDERVKQLESFQTLLYQDDAESSVDDSEDLLDVSLDVSMDVSMGSFSGPRTDGPKPGIPPALLRAIVALQVMWVMRRRKAIPREHCYTYARKDWDDFVEMEFNIPTLERLLRMPYRSFLTLVELLRPQLALDEEQAARHGIPIGAEYCVFLTLRYLAGGSYLDITMVLKISVPAFYYCLTKTMQAICLCQRLDISFPVSEEELMELSVDFQSISFGDAIQNCVGAVDGYLCAITTPRKSDTDNVKSFFSRHYQRNGVNVQAVVDSHCRFLYFAMAAPGSVNDRVAIQEEDEDGKRN